MRLGLDQSKMWKIGSGSWWASRNGEQKEKKKTGIGEKSQVAILFLSFPLSLSLNLSPDLIALRSFPVWARLSTCLFVCLSVCLSVCLYCLSEEKKKSRFFIAPVKSVITLEPTIGIKKTQCHVVALSPVHLLCLMTAAPRPPPQELRPREGVQRRKNTKLSSFFRKGAKKTENFLLS